MSAIRAKKLSIPCDRTELAGGAFIPDDPKGTLVLLHGMPSSLAPPAGTLDYPTLAHRLAGNRWATVWADMRAVRGSAGYFSIEGWVRDARAIADAARSLHPTEDLPSAFVATSAGGAVAVEATRRGAPVDAVVLLAAPAAWVSFAVDAHDAARRAVKDNGLALSPEDLADPVEWAAEFDRVTTEESIASLNTPVLIVHGDADAVVPVSHAHRLGDRAPHAELRIIAGGEHNLRQDQAVMTMVEAWLEKTFADLPRRDPA
ncbi:MAG: alpha/beta hydrolase [Actinobacteria bacterium]|nr:alpha/beta hydrolase [Actinomycetota bacterium]